MRLKKLNLGCGTDIKDGWVNVDSSALPGVDVVHDIDKLPLPFPDASFDEILCQDVLEHVEYIPVMKDLHRLLLPGGRLHIRVPHFTSKNSVIDPTHEKFFSVSTFDYFVTNTMSHERRSYYFDFAFSKIEERRITFELSSRFFFYNKIIRKLANRSLRSQERYESTGFSRLFPAQNIQITLVK